MVKDSKETVPCRHNRTDAHMNPQRKWQHTEHLHRLKPDKISTLRKEVDTKLHIQLSVYLQLTPSRRCEISFLQCIATRYINHNPVSVPVLLKHKELHGFECECVLGGGVCLLSLFVYMCKFCFILGFFCH